MLTSLSITNFKAWQHIDNMPLAPLTALFGSNSSGKTSILQFLLMLKQTAATSDRKVLFHLGDENSAINLGTTKDIAFNHNTHTAIRFSLSWCPPSASFAITTAKGVLPIWRMTLSCNVQLSGNERPTVTMINYDTGHGFVTLSRKNDDGDYELLSTGALGRFKRSKGRPWELSAPIKFYGFPDESRIYFKDVRILQDLEYAVEQQLKHIYYLGPLREPPKRRYTWSGNTPSDMGQRGEAAVEAIIASRHSGERIGRGKGNKKLTLEQYVAHWLKELGLVHSFRIVPIDGDENLFRVMVQRSPDSAEVSITDVGFGVSQVLPVLVLCYYAPRGSTIIFEQPEIHLHPAVQRHLADLFLDAIQVRDVQIIIESHSEDLLRRLQRRAAEDADTKERLRVYFCDTQHGKSTLMPLELDEAGSFVQWPKDFFGDPIGDLAATQRAIMANRAQASRQSTNSKE